jgi:hypothetical protein
VVHFYRGVVLFYTESGSFLYREWFFSIQRVVLFCTHSIKGWYSFSRGVVLFYKGVVLFCTHSIEEWFFSIEGVVLFYRGSSSCCTFSINWNIQWAHQNKHNLPNWYNICSVVHIIYTVRETVTPKYGSRLNTKPGW